MKHGHTKPSKRLSNQPAERCVSLMSLFISSSDRLQSNQILRPQIRTLNEELRSVAASPFPSEISRSSSKLGLNSTFRHPVER
ncbi:hypothetical protein ROHU_022650 [Labeo rohita]|uniref:Uncharacterized protein n=1 Tax=Labeo rohita TaxID=84645 RepID=A0A498MSF7_LABRO|nr:hypothetical protein ROHU_022650 [Labeo rohita]